MNKAIGYRAKPKQNRVKGSPPGIGNENKKDEGLGIPSDTLASSAKAKSLRGRNRELRFICEREKRVLEWDWHRVKVGLEKEKSLFKKRALRMLEAPRHRYHTPKNEENEERVVPETPKKTYVPRRRPTIDVASGLDKQVKKTSTGSRTPSFSSTDDCVMLEELQELNARLNLEKKACRSAPLVKNSVLTDPLYQLSSRLPKLEEEFSEMIKEHNALRNQKVEYKVKDFLVRVENFKHGQIEPKGLYLHHSDSITNITASSAGQGNKPLLEVEASEPRMNQISLNMYIKTPISQEKKTLQKPKAHSAKLYKPRIYSPVVRKPASLNVEDLDDDVFEPSRPQSPNKSVKARPSRIEVEKSTMLDTWDEFRKDMSLGALKKLVSLAAKNKKDPNGSVKVNVCRKIVESLKTGENESRT